MSIMQFQWPVERERDCFDYTLLCFVIGRENSCYFSNQSDAKVKPITTWLLAFSRALRSLVAFTFSSHWLLNKGIFLHSDWPL